MQLFTDEQQLMHAKYLCWLQASALHPGEYYWTWQTTEGYLKQMEYTKSHELLPRNFIRYKIRRKTRTLRETISKAGR